MRRRQKPLRKLSRKFRSKLGWWLPWSLHRKIRGLLADLEAASEYRGDLLHRYQNLRRKVDDQEKATQTRQHQAFLVHQVDMVYDKFTDFQEQYFALLQADPDLAGNLWNETQSVQRLGQRLGGLTTGYASTYYYMMERRG